LAAIVVYAELFRQGEWSESLGRFAFLGVMLLLLSFVHSMLGARNNVLREQIVRNSGSWLNRLRIVAYAAGIVVPAFLALLAALGYYYSAQQLAVRLQATLALVLGLVTLHATASRWFLVKRRNLAIQQARQRQQQSEATASDTPGMADVSSLDQLPDLTALHGKLQLLLAQAAIVCVLAGAWFIWSDVLPALRVLDRVVLWQTSIDVTETYEDANGNTQWRKVPRDVPTTLCHLLVAAALLIGTFVIGRNLPALLEIIILNRLPIDKGGRHAISVLLRYGVALTGIILACQTMHVGWSSVQWLAAGMTVGLGFGLQEIFANFVSGLILLFERPIRVGDVITLGDITGVVTDIRIRATTVRNWDRKELVVPNKALITGQLLNWTLSDTTNRIRFTVGVAYKSDPVRTRDILLSIVKDHPQVLDDPAPLVTLEQFGDSTLVFVVRAFVASLDVRLATIHELHTEIHRRLGNAGIEIAYPQRDINIRGLEQLLSPPAASTRPISSAEAA
jgi:potassium efflux system protein